MASYKLVNQPLYDGLQMLRCHGQDAAGIITAGSSVSYMHEGKRVAREVFRTRNMHDLVSNAGVTHVCYPTTSSTGSDAEVQPFYVSSPSGIILAYDGNLTNATKLYENVCYRHLHHTNTFPDSEVLLNVFVHEPRQEVSRNADNHLTVDNIFSAAAQVHHLVSGAYGVVTVIAGYGVVALRDPYGIRPLTLGIQDDGGGRKTYAVAPESMAFNTSESDLECDIVLGGTVFISFDDRPSS